MLALLAFALCFGTETVPRAGTDRAPAPERIHYVRPEYPAIARQAMVMGIIAFEVGLDEEGKPVEIKVLRGTPMLDAAALEAVKQWRYRPTVVDGIPRRTTVVEVIDFFPDDGERASYFAAMLANRKESKAYRHLALARLTAMPRSKKATKALQKAAEDPDEDIRDAAKAALQDWPEARK